MTDGLRSGGISYSGRWGGGGVRLQDRASTAPEPAKDSTVCLRKGVAVRMSKGAAPPSDFTGMWTGAWHTARMSSGGPCDGACGGNGT